ncbi:hypothetical protein SKAU_G00243310 [Synaphobranchus kaupii]|uniref:Uncharacterized protein n=1 Tax=Synaphobranchus kaupii TaxID=118154 RepID=A0A9Q1ITK2_SYNKA|nr:hypothetical protein SKAU_G00243310 [Synaphobranchus kaupii]
MASRCRSWCGGGGSVPYLRNKPSALLCGARPPATGLQSDSVTHLPSRAARRALPTPHCGDVITSICSNNQTKTVNSPVEEGLNTEYVLLRINRRAADEESNTNKETRTERFTGLRDSR